MDDSSPLAMQFKELDTDGDNKLTVDEVHELFKLLGKNIYKGSITSAAKMLNYNDEASTGLFSFSQFKQFFEALQNPLRHDIWKGKYKILRGIKTVRDTTYGKEDLSTAAPGASAPGQKPQAQQTPFKGDIEITVGPTDQVYDSFIHVSLQKAPKPESKPFIKIVFEHGSNESAKKMQQKFKKFQTSFFDLMKSSDPESAQILDFIHIITNVSDNKLNVFVTTSNQSLIQIGSLAAQFIDRVLGQKLQAKLEFKHKFCVDIQKFIDKTSDYSFYHALTKNYHSRLQWQAINFKQSAKQVLKAMQAYSELEYNKMDPPSLILIGILHTQLCEAKFVFDNADVQVTQLDTKTMILQELAEMYLQVQQEGGDLGIFQLINSFDNKIYVQACIGDWKANVNIQIKNLKELFSAKIAPEKQEQQETQAQSTLLLAQQNSAKLQEKGDNSSQKSYGSSQKSLKKKSLSPQMLKKSLTPQKPGKSKSPQLSQGSSSGDE